MNLGMDVCLVQDTRRRAVAQTALDTLGWALTMIAMEGTLNSRLAGIELPDTDGRQLLLGSLWRNQPAVMVFLRHYG